MRAFWQHCKAAWNYGRTFPYIEEADADTFWETGDSVNLLLFLKSYTGQKFKIRLRNFGIQSALSEATKLDSPRGKASGVLSLIAYIEAHAKPEEPESEPETVETLETAAT